MSMSRLAVGLFILIALSANGICASFPSSYIPTTTAAVTRNADDLSFDTSGNFANTVGTATATVDLIGLISSVAQTALDFGGSSYALGKRTTGVSSTYDGTTTIATTGALSANTAYKLATAWNSSGSRYATVRGGGTVATGSFDGSMNYGASSYIGGVHYTSPFYGHVKNLRIWSRAFTDAELQAITTP